MGQVLFSSVLLLHPPLRDAPILLARSGFEGVGTALVNPNWSNLVHEIHDWVIPFASFCPIQLKCLPETIVVPRYTGASTFTGDRLPTGTRDPPEVRHTVTFL